MKIIFADSSYRQKIINFLLPYEQFCVSLMNKIEDENLGVFVLEDSTKNKLFGVLSVSFGGQILHCLSDFFCGADSECRARRKDEYNLLVDFFSNRQIVKNLFSIIGEKNGTAVIAKAIEKSILQKPVHVEEYILMEKDNSPCDEVDIEDSKIVLCNSEMIEEIFPLQENFEKEEILFGERKFNPELTHFLLERALKKQTFFAVKKNGKIIAKAGTNAKGKNFVQLGGVYTIPSERNHGYAYELICHLEQVFLNHGIKIVLFVKKHNIPALFVYKKTGFSPKGYFSIYYYQV